MSFRVALIRRFLTDAPATIGAAKQYIGLNDFYDILQRIIFPDNSHGRLGGKSTGLLLASQILRKSSDNAELFRNIKTPKTWYITSDAILSFIHYNNLEDVIDQKYKEITQVRQVTGSFFSAVNLVKIISVTLSREANSPTTVSARSVKH